ncbi:hypothetical protein ACQKIC_17640 [Peribacillus sp. NPDC046944]|uniref:hypothetical protein n=1 Tax=unclassified Peribacillus TaxID=2675266 RepID=UPI003CFF9F04
MDSSIHACDCLYFIVFLFGLLAGGILLWGLTVIYFGHIVLDRQTFVSFWGRNIQMADEDPGLVIDHGR